jgi:hypothetical protein
MHYETAVSQQDFLEFSHNSREVAQNLWVSDLPSYHESIGYELRGSILVVKYEDTEDERITYGNPAYILSVISPTIALACALHKRQLFQLGKSIHNIHVAVNRPDGAFIAEPQVIGGMLMHQAAGLVFVKEKNFMMAVTDETVAQLYIQRLGMAIGNAINNRYLIRFHHEGKYVYFPLAHVFADPLLRSSYLREHEEAFDWDGKRTEIETFVEEWTK